LHNYIGNINESISKLKEQQEEQLKKLSQANREKVEREKKAVEEAERTRQILNEFKVTVQDFIKSSEEQIIASKEINKTMKTWTKAIGLMTIAMIGFAALTLIFTILTYYKS
jgi:hypothetical protein